MKYVEVIIQQGEPTVVKADGFTFGADGTCAGQQHVENVGKYLSGEQQSLEVLPEALGNMEVEVDQIVEVEE